METHALSGVTGIITVVILAVLVPLGVWLVVRRPSAGAARSPDRDATLDPGTFPVSSDLPGDHHHHHHHSGDQSIGGGDGGGHGGHHH